MKDFERLAFVVPDLMHAVLSRTENTDLVHALVGASTDVTSAVVASLSPEAQALLEYDVDHTIVPVEFIGLARQRVIDTLDELLGAAA